MKDARVIPSPAEGEGSGRGLEQSLHPDPSLRLGMTTVGVYTIPTATPESDGTAEWDSTTLVAVHVTAGDETGFGYSYADRATATVIHDRFIDLLRGRDPMAIDSIWAEMIRSVRNIGRRGIAAMAISAVDNALWDLKSKLLDVPLVTLLGQVRKAIPAYGSGGFTSYSIDELTSQLGRWSSDGFRFVKMKIGRDAVADRERVAAARHAIGTECELFVDSNGAYGRKQAIEQGDIFSASDVRWFEEPVSSDDLDGLRFIRERAPASMEIAAGEYGYELQYFDEMLAAGAVDVLQVDATRCCGITGFIKASALCEARSIPLSSHCAPSLHVPLGCAMLPMRHLEYFFDHARIETMLFDGFRAPHGGEIEPDLSRPGIGVELKTKDAERFRV